MSSKFGVFGCLTCGEYVRSTMNDSIELFEMHMCCDTTPERKLERFLKLREVVDTEIAKVTQSSQAPPPPPPPPLPPAPSSLISSTLKGSLKEQLDEVKLKKGLSAKSPNMKSLEFVRNVDVSQKFGIENAPNLLNLYGHHKNELEAPFKKRTKHH